MDGQTTSRLYFPLQLLASSSVLADDASPAAQVLSKRKAMYMCKCTCFSTNSTVVPLFAPADPSKPCLTCTRKFCLDQGLEICKGAKLEAPDHDTGTGYEGDVWARCFRESSLFCAFVQPVSHQLVGVYRTRLLQRPNSRLALCLCDPRPADLGVSPAAPDGFCAGEGCCLCKVGTL